MNFRSIIRGSSLYNLTRRAHYQTVVDVSQDFIQLIQVIILKDRNQTGNHLESYLFSDPQVENCIT